MNSILFSYCGGLYIRGKHPHQCHQFLYFSHLAISLHACESDDIAACLNLYSIADDGGRGLSGSGITFGFFASLSLPSLF